MKNRVPILALILLFSGCATNYFERFYQDKVAADAIGYYLPYSGKSQVFGSSDQAQDSIHLLENGYLLLGDSSFVTPAKTTIEMLKSYAKQVGADVVLWTSSYQGQVQANLPMMQYNPGPSYTATSSGTGTATAFGPAGSATAFGSYSGRTTVTTPGNFSMAMMAMNLPRYSHYASFWRKGVPPLVGIRCAELSTELKQKLQRNGGEYVVAVVNGSPAFVANILPGDIITKMGDFEILTPDMAVGPDFTVYRGSAQVGIFRGKTLIVTLIRNGQEKTVTLKAN
jgi:hypothetical protein